MLKVFNSFNKDFDKFDKSFNTKPLTEKQTAKKFVEFEKLILKLERVRDQDLEKIDTRPGAKKTRRNVTVLNAFGMISRLEGQINKVKGELEKVNKQIEARNAAKSKIAAYERSNRNRQFQENLNGLLARGPGNPAPVKSRNKPIQSKDVQLEEKKIKLSAQLEKFEAYKDRIETVRNNWSRSLPAHDQTRAQENWKRLHDRVHVIVEGNTSETPTTKNLWAESLEFKLNKPKGKRTASCKIKLAQLQPHIEQWRRAPNGLTFKTYMQNKIDEWMQFEKEHGVATAELTAFRQNIIKSKKDFTPIEGKSLGRKMLAELYWREPIEFRLNNNKDDENAQPCRLYINQVKAHFETWEKSSSPDSFQKYLQDKLDNWMQEEKNTGVTPPELTIFRKNRVKMLRPEERKDCEVEFRNGMILQNGVPLRDSSKDVQYIFVLAKHPEKDRKDEPPVFLVAEKKTGQLQHSSLFNGKGVISAGMLEIKNGKIIEINNHSGHYQPTRAMTMEAVKYLSDPTRLGPKDIKKVKIKAMRDWQWKIFNKVLMPIHIWLSNKKI